MCGACVLIPYHTQSWLVADRSPTPAAGLCQPEAVPGWDHPCTDSCATASQRLYRSEQDKTLPQCPESQRKISLPFNRHWEIAGEVCASCF